MRARDYTEGELQICAALLMLARDLALHGAVPMDEPMAIEKMLGLEGAIAATVIALVKKATEEN